MSNKKETAVDWLFTKQDLEDFDTLMLYKIAKQMEKEQMIKFAIHLHKVDNSKTGTDILMDEAEQYYNETYGK